MSEEMICYSILWLGAVYFIVKFFKGALGD